MKKFLALWMCVLAAAASAAQGVRYDGQVTTSATNVAPGAMAPVLSVPSSTVVVCTYVAVAACTTPTATVYSDYALTQPITQPITADLQGRFGFWIAPGQYSYGVSLNRVYLGTFPLTLTAPMGPQGPAGPAGTTTATGALGAFTVPGLLTTTTQGGTSTFATASGTHSSSTPSPQSIQRNNTITVTGSGWSFGNVGGWTVSQGEQDVMNVYQRGIAHNQTYYLTKHATGDAAGLYSYTFSDGGSTAGSDEGIANATFEGGETTGYFHGTISSTSGTGDKHPVLSFSSGADALTDGAILLDISKGTVAGSLNGYSSSFQSSYMTQLPVTGVTVNGVAGSLPLSTAYGLIQSALPQQNSTADSPQPVTVNINLGLIGASTPPFTTGVATLGGAWYGEQVQITAVGTPSAGVQSVTMNTRNPNPIYNYLFQGGLAGQYLSFDANLALSGYRSSYEVLGSIDGTHLVYFLTIGAGQIESISLPQVGTEAETPTGANAGFHLYPGAEIVKNDPAATSPTLEANAVPWAAGDVIENPHPVEQGGHGVWVTTTRNSPCYFQYGCEGLEVDAAGKGVSAAFSMFKGVNYAPDNTYADGGGPLSAPTYMYGGGQFGTDFVFLYGPQHSGSVLYFNQLANGIAPSAWTTPIPIVKFGSWGCGELDLTPSTSYWSACAFNPTGSFKLASGTPLTGNQGTGPNLMHCDAGTFTAGDVLTVAADGSCQDGGPSSASGVASINSTAGAFTFTGPGVGCSGTTCTFSGTGTGVGSFSSPSGLSPLFSTSVASPTTAPVLSFSLTNAPAYSVWGNFTGSSATPGYSNAPVFSAANLINFPTFNQNTTGNAGNITAATNSTLTTLPNLSLPGTQVTGTVPAATTAGNITGTTNSTLTSLPNLVLPTASTTVPGAVKVDGTTITIASGVISSTSSGGATTPNTTNLLKGNGAINSVVAATPGSDYVVPSGSITGTASNITATTNTTLTTLSNLSLPGSQVTGTVPAATTAANTTATTNSTLTTLPNLSLPLGQTTGTLSAANGGLGINTSASAGYPSVTGGAWSIISASTLNTILFETTATAVGDLIYGGTAGAPTRLAAGTAGYCLTSGGPATAPLWASCGTGGGGSWSALTAPTANLALAMSNYNTTMTFGAATGSATNMYTLTDTASNTGTGYTLAVKTATSSAASPFAAYAAGATTPSAYVSSTGQFVDHQTSYGSSGSCGSGAGGGISITSPGHTGCFFVDGNNNLELYISGGNVISYSPIGSAQSIIQVGGVSTAGSFGVPFVVTTPTRLTGQTTSIAATNLQCSAAICPAGLYRISFAGAATTLGSASNTLTLNCISTDNAGADTQSSSAFSLTAAVPSAAFGYLCLVYTTGTANIQYSTTLSSTTGSPAYALSVYMERLQ
jgi:hypothetical protein